MAASKSVTVHWRGN